MKSDFKNKKKIEIKYEETEHIKINQEIGNSVKQPVERDSSNNNLNKIDLKIKKTSKNLETEIKKEKSKNELNESLSTVSENPEKIILPKNFHKIWNFMESIREAKKAPVNRLNYDLLLDPNRTDRKTFKFQILISALLSSLTKASINYSATMKLINHGLTVDKMIETDEETIRELIHGCAFHNNKAKFIKKTALIIKEKYNSDPPEDLQEVLKLPGIGPKIAYVYLELGCQKREGIIVDTHVQRITKRLKWVNDTKTPEETRKELENWLPKDKWLDFNFLMVAFGQTYCIANDPKCTECEIKKFCEYGNQRLNESGGLKKSKSISNSKKILEKDEEEKNLVKKNSVVKRKSDTTKQVYKKMKK
jgi:endonuclease III